MMVSTEKSVFCPAAARVFARPGLGTHYSGKLFGASGIPAR